MLRGKLRFQKVIRVIRVSEGGVGGGLLFQVFEKGAFYYACRILKTLG